MYICIMSACMYGQRTTIWSSVKLPNASQNSLVLHEAPLNETLQSSLVLGESSFEGLPTEAP